MAINSFPISAQSPADLNSSNMTSPSIFVTSGTKLKQIVSGLQRNRTFVRADDWAVDSDIFSLGSAFKDANLNVDEFFKNMPPIHSSGEIGPSQTVQSVITTSRGQDGTVTTIRRVKTPNIDAEEIQTLPMGLSKLGIAPAGVLGELPGFDTLQRNERQIRNENCISQYEGVTGSDDDDQAETPSKKTPKIEISEPADDACADAKREVESPSVVTTGDGSSASEFSSSDEMKTDRLLWPTDVNKRSGQNRTPQVRRQRGHDKGKMGMMARPVTLPGEEKKLPIVQQMVINFSRMLDSDRDQFADVLFRAVKLNGIAVVKILCQLVARKGLKLSSEQLRERESSATVLHVALLCNHELLASYLIDLDDKDLIMSVYTKPEYRKQTTLHVAIGNGNRRLVNRLLASLSRRDRKALINTLADGSYFVNSHPDGQLCLTAAAWVGNGDQLVDLAKHGANFAVANVSGDTLMHRLVWSSSAQPGKMDYELMVDKVLEAIWEWSKRRRYKASISDQKMLERRQRQVNTFHRLLNIQNDAGETPLSLAAQLNSDLLGYLMNLDGIYKIPQTKLGSISWVTYDVTEVTTLAHGRYNKFSVLHVLAHNSGKLSRHANLDEEAESSDLLDVEPISSLIQMKWSVYRWVYVFWMCLHIVFVVLFTYFTLDQYSAAMTPVYEEHGQSVHTITHFRINYYLGVFLTLPTVYIVLELIDWFGIYPYSILSMRNHNIVRRVLLRMKSEWVITGNGPYRFVCFTYSVLTITWYALYVSRVSCQDVALSMSLLLGWIFILFFTRGCRVTSRFSIMIQKMFFRDLMNFLAVYVVILAAFSISISGMSSFTQTSKSEFPSVMYQMLNIVTDLDQRVHGSFEKNDQRPMFAKILVVFYAIVAVVLLMNMLIAMMNTSYETVRITKCNLCRQQQLSIMLMIERRLFWWRWLSSKSETDVWFKVEDDAVFRAYLDVTTTAKIRGNNDSKAET
ncbi:hypothetical protein LSH36_471g04014 [Paralvinella palmiformis]|uniref:Ion transport domain-containing protein n=1 Tax=Paralvinella palmiformis TaxID=53620 RepID=A0AAD9MX45_9ANNE|nr:hypothetical protein LSH36_471g04014 [Paralvinella palmiformis]